MKEITNYKIAWNAKKDEGVLVLYTANKKDGVERIHVDSAAESDLLLDILNNEKPVFYQHGLLFTGFEPSGEIAEKAAPQKTKKVSKKKAKKGTKDNLQLIEGIGKKIEGLLNEGGILTFRDLKAADQSILKQILTTAGNPYKMHDPTTWGQQAALAAAGKMDELKKWQDELDGGKEKK